MSNMLQSSPIKAQPLIRPNHTRLVENRLKASLPSHSLTGIGELIERATKACIPRQGDDALTFAQPQTPGRLLPHQRRTLRRPPSDLFVITLMSYEVKICITFVVERTEKIWEYYQEPDIESASAQFMERMNMMAGDLSRRLQPSLTHTGISTPARLNGDCGLHLSSLSPNYAILRDILIAGVFKARLASSIHLSRPIELKNAAEEPHAEFDAGELELF